MLKSGPTSFVGLPLLLAIEVFFFFFGISEFLVAVFSSFSFGDLEANRRFAAPINAETKPGAIFGTDGW